MLGNEKLGETRRLLGLLNGSRVRNERRGKPLTASVVDHVVPPWGQHRRSPHWRGRSPHWNCRRHHWDERNCWRYGSRRQVRHRRAPTIPPSPRLRPPPRLLHF